MDQYCPSKNKRINIEKSLCHLWAISYGLLFFFFFEKKLWPSWCNCGFRKLSFAQIMWILNCPICKVFYCQWASGLLTHHTHCRVCVCGSLLQSPSHFCFFVFFLSAGLWSSTLNYAMIYESLKDQTQLCLLELYQNNYAYNYKLIMTTMSIKFRYYDIYLQNCTKY